MTSTGRTASGHDGAALKALHAEHRIVGGAFGPDGATLRARRGAHELDDVERIGMPRIGRMVHA